MTDYVNRPHPSSKKVKFFSPLPPVYWIVNTFLELGCTSSENFLELVVGGVFRKFRIEMEDGYGCKF